MVRGRVLQFLFKRRDEDAVAFGAAEGAASPPPGIDYADWLRAAAQLADCGLISWEARDDKRGTGMMAGRARITDAGIAVLEGRDHPALDIRFAGKRAL